MLGVCNRGMNDILHSSGEDPILGGQIIELSFRPGGIRTKVGERGVMNPGKFMGGSELSAPNPQQDRDPGRDPD